MSKTIEVDVGLSIYNAARQASRLSKQERTEVEFLFNDISLRVTPESNPDDIAEIYGLKCEIRRLKHHTK